MQNIFDTSKEDLDEIFTQTALRMGMGLPTIVEKDFWVVRLLQLLFSDNDFRQHHVFKGGTSLSKCFGLIQRFSEDVDITISKKILGLNESKEAISALGSKKQKRYFKELESAATNHVNKILHTLSKQVQSYVNNAGASIYVDPENEQTIIFEYPKSLHASLYAEDSYVQPRILLEFGCRGDTTPSSIVNVTTYAEESFSDIFSKSDIIVNALTPERTFWEKITLLHKLAHRDSDKPLKIRMARHYYDICKLSRSSIIESATNDLALLESVAAHTSIYFRSKQASYHTAKPGSLKLIPDQRLLTILEADYEAMAEMFFGNTISFKEILEEITALEKKLNTMQSTVY